MTRRFKVCVEFIIDAETELQAENVLRKTLNETLTWYFVETKLDRSRKEVYAKGGLV